VENKPKFMELASNYKENDNIAFLTLSVDSSTERWKNFLKKDGVNNHTQELLIPDGINAQFGKKYSVTTIPRYILIDTNGLIINANLPDPSNGMGTIIDELLAK
jgi:hypothetical protein